MAKVLIIDDEPNVLSAMQRELRKTFEISTAESGDEAIEIFNEHPDIGVVLCDMKMPGLNGIETISELRQINTNLVAVMLTGLADVEVAMQAINDGQIFRFLTKPCPAMTLQKSLNDADKQYQLVTAEKDLLERTLAGSVKLLVDLLAARDPVAFGRSSSLKAMVSKISKTLKLDRIWELELAAMLAPLDSIHMPDNVMEKLIRNNELNADENEVAENGLAITQTLLSNIPRLEGVAGILHDRWLAQEEDPDNPAKLLRICEALLDLKILGVGYDDAIEKLRADQKNYDAAILSQLGSMSSLFEKKIDEDVHYKMQSLSVGMLRENYILCDDVKLENGTLMLAEGLTLSAEQIKLMRRLRRTHGIIEPVEVLVPSN